MKKGSIQSDFGIVDNGYCHDHGWEYSLSEIRIISRVSQKNFLLSKLAMANITVDSEKSI